MKRKLSATHISIALGLVIVLGIGSLIYVQKAQFGRGPGQPQGWGQRPGGAQDFGGPPRNAQKPRWNGPIPVAPAYKITYYKGLWSGPFYPEERTGIKIDPDIDRKLGINIVMLQPGFEINRQGEVRYPPDFPTYEDMDARIGELATKFYKANIHVGLGVTLTYKEKFSEGQKGEKWAGEPQPFPREVVEKPGYLDTYTNIVGDMAKIAEKYHVYLFTPAGEVEDLWGMNVAPSWIQKIIPIVRKNYTGKLYYKGDLHNGEGDVMNFKGYDIVGIVDNPVGPRVSPEEARKIYVSDMERGLSWAKRDDVPEVVISEYGYLGENKMESATKIGLVLEEGNKRLNGVFVSIPEPAMAQSNQKEEIYTVIKKWFVSH